MSCSACLFVFLGTLARFGDRQGVVRELNDASQEAVFPVRARVGATEHPRHPPSSVEPPRLEASGGAGKSFTDTPAAPTGLYHEHLATNGDDAIALAAGVQYPDASAMPAWAQEVLYTREAEAALSGEGELHEDVLGAAEGAEATGAASASDEVGVQPLRQGLLTPS